MHRFAFLIAALLVFPAQLSAGTVEKHLSLGEGEETQITLASPARAHVEDPEVVSARMVERAEVRLRGLSPGTSLVFLHGDRGLSAFRVSVRSAEATEAKEAALRAVAAACDAFERTGAGFEVLVRSADCHAAVVNFSPYVLSERLAVRFDERGLRAQLAAQKARLREERPEMAEELSLLYLGATLRVRGRLPGPRARDEVLRSVFHATAGRLLVDLDHLEVGTEDYEPARGEEDEAESSPAPGQGARPGPDEGELGAPSWSTPRGAGSEAETR